jgi:flagellar basal body P-ring protein FlgI
MTSLLENQLIERTTIKITQDQAIEIGTALIASTGVTVEIEKDNNVKQLLVFKKGENDV